MLRGHESNQDPHKGAHSNANLPLPPSPLRCNLGVYPLARCTRTQARKLHLNLVAELPGIPGVLHSSEGDRGSSPVYFALVKRTGRRGGGGGGKWPTGVTAADNPLPPKHLRAAPMPSSPLSARGSRGRVTNQAKLHITEMRLERHERSKRGE